MLAVVLVKRAVLQVVFGKSRFTPVSIQGSLKFKKQT
jgi:hypothetical protein